MMSAFLCISLIAPMQDHSWTIDSASGAYPIMLAHQPGNMADLVKSPFNRSFAIRVNQTAGRRRQETAGQQQIKINASLPAVVFQDITRSRLLIMPSSIS
jgi:hypothetical protein